VADKNIQITLDRRTVQLLGFALAIAAALYLVNHNPLSSNNGAPKPGSSFPSAISVAPFGPAVVTVDELKAEAKKFALAAYWGGEIADTKMELTVTANGGFYVRYLPLDAKVGTKTEYLTVASTYDSGAYSKVADLTTTVGSRWTNYATGALAASATPTDHNIYFAFQDYPVLVDVFTPDAKVGWDMVQAGSVKLLK
jgi:hypothetical protein